MNSFSIRRGNAHAGTDYGTAFFVLAIILAIVGIAGFNIFRAVGNEATHSNCIVNGKDRTVGSEMRVYTENCGTFTVGDNVFKGVWDSADIYGKLETGKTYTFATTGVRNGFLSAFPTIYEATLTD